MSRAATVACPVETGADTNAGVELPVILVVEDDVLIRLAIAEHLRTHDFIVIEAVNATEAVAVLEAGEHVDVVFSDVHLPAGMDGFALAHWIETHHPRIGLLLTSGVAPSPPRRAAGGEPTAFVRKPYDPETVEAQIRRLIDRLAPGGNGRA